MFVDSAFHDLLW